MKNGSEDPNKDLSNLIGLESFRQEIELLKNQKEFYGQVPHQKILLIGDDGCGKSSITKILTGYLCDIRQIDIVRKFIKEFRDQSTIVVVDPVMGDNGRVYSGYSSKVCQGITELVKSADIVTPNLTEACLITSRDYKEVVINHKLVEEMAKEISEMGPEKVVISGILKDNMIGDYVFEKDGAKEFLFNDIVGISREGTGDVFSAIIAADAVNDVPFVESVKKGSDFIRRCLVISDERNIPREDGICFEDLLTTLH